MSDITPMPPTILFVDDDPLILKAFGRHVQGELGGKNNVVILTAAEPNKAIAIIKEKRDAIARVYSDMNLGSKLTGNDVVQAALDAGILPEHILFASGADFPDMRNFSGVLKIDKTYFVENLERWLSVLLPQKTE